MICPYCAEEIKDDAILCRFCRKNLSSKVIEASVNVTTEVQNDNKWMTFRKKIFISVAAVILIGFSVFFFTLGSEESRTVIVNGALTQFQDRIIIIPDTCTDIDKAKQIIIQFYTLANASFYPPMDEEWVANNRICFDPIIVAMAIL